LELGELFQRKTQSTDDFVKAELFNKYFYLVFTKEDMTSFPTLQQSTTISPSLVDCFEFTPADVYDYLSNIDGSKACGPDLLPGFLLKHCASSLASPLAYLFNFSMCTG